MKRENSIVVRVTDRELAAIKEKAAAHEQSMAEYMRRAALDKPTPKKGGQDK